MNRYAVIVDPLSTGQEYPPAFAEVGMTPIGVLSGAEPVSALRDHWKPENYAHAHYFDGDIGKLAAELRAYTPECIVPGAETGVELYEALVPLVLPGSGNIPELAAARRDKGAMATAVAAAGIPHLRQFCSADHQAIAGWLAETGLDREKIVLKPPKAAGTDNVHAVPPGGDWRSAADQIIGKINTCGLVNQAVLVQEFADGYEYLVDSYSVNGRHGLVDVCRYTKVSRRDRIGIYDRVDFLPPEDPQVLQVWRYVQRVLDAVGVRNGCGHTEVMLTAAGPRLIEIAERPAGGGHQLITKLATGDNHILRTVAHHSRGQFTESYELLQHVRGMFLSAPLAGSWRNGELFDSVDQLKTFYARHLPAVTGDVVPETVDLTSYLGWVILVGPVEAEIESDYDHIKALERSIVIEPTALESIGPHGLQGIVG